MKKKIVTGWLVAALIPLSFIASYHLLGLYTEGDQIVYHNLYQALNGSDIGDIVFLSTYHTGGAEPLSALIFWIGSNLGVEKNIYISFLNVILVASLFLLARKNHVKMPMILLLLSNFYILVLICTAERLKIAYIFLIIAMLFVGKVRIFLLACTPFAHLQSIILLSCVLLSYLNPFSKLNLRFDFHTIVKNTRMLFFIGIIFTIVGLFLYEAISQKFENYADKYSALELLNVMILMIVAIYVTRRRSYMAFLILPLLPAIMLIGGSRVNMIAVTLVIYTLMKERRLDHPMIYFLMIYFSFKSIDFIERVLLTGQGFA